jgi:hypothetical protein
MRSLPLVLLLCLTAAAPSTDSLPGVPGQDVDEAQQLIDRALDAYGGAERVRGVMGLRQEGMLIAVQNGGHSRVVRVAACPEDLSVLIEYPDRSEIRIIEGEEAWRGGSPGAMAPVSGPLRGAMVLQAARTCLPMVLDAFREGAILEESGEAYDIVTLSVADGMRLRVYLSTETHLTLRSESLLDMGRMTMAFASDYADYQSVDGLLFPFREETFAQGVHTASVRLEHVEVNPEGDRALLPLPKGQ